MLVSACAMAALPMVSVPAWAAPTNNPDSNNARRLTADIVCAARKTDRQSGYRYRYDVTLSVRQGTVRRLKLSQRVTSKQGDEQGCQIDLKDLKQTEADGAIMLRESNVDEGDKPRCTVRITTDNQHIRIKIGDTAGERNDCRGGDTVMYCSPRAFWADMIVDRKSSACRPVE